MILVFSFIWNGKPDHVNILTLIWYY